MSNKRPIILEGFLQEYAWGRGEDSIIKSLSATVSKSGRYAELWFGMHPKGPTRYMRGTERGELAGLIEQEGAAILGERVSEAYDGKLPFLFKILSVNQALSIQAHPDKVLAVELHKKDPEHYPDPFPKPEVGIAISEVEILYDLRSFYEVKNFFDKAHPLYVPELSAFGELPDEHAMLDLYKAVLTAEDAQIASASHTLYSRLAAKQECSKEEAHILALKDVYPHGDRGLFSFFLLNFLSLSPGEALYIAPCIPHAYISGELLECMAPSDNVVRAGLTPKFVDVKTLLSMLDGVVSAPVTYQATPTQEAGYSLFDIPLSEYFKIGMLTLNEKMIDVAKSSDCEFLFCLSGNCQLIVAEQSYQMQAGGAFLIPACCDSYCISGVQAEIVRVSVP